MTTSTNGCNSKGIRTRSIVQHLALMVNALSLHHLTKQPRCGGLAGSMICWRGVATGCRIILSPIQRRGRGCGCVGRGDRRREGAGREELLNSDLAPYFIVRQEINFLAQSLSPLKRTLVSFSVCFNRLGLLAQNLSSGRTQPEVQDLSKGVKLAAPSAIAHTNHFWR